MWTVFKRLLLLFVFTTGQYSVVHANERLSIYGLIANDWIYHGVSETAGNPNLGINIEYQASSIAVLGLTANEANVQGVRQRHRNITPYIGAEFAINDNWFGGVYIQARRFLDSAREWDFEEYSTTLSHQNGFSARLDYSPDYYSSGLTATTLALKFQRPVYQSLYATAAVGHVELGSEQDYQYGHVKLGFRYKRYSASLGYYHVSRSFLSSAIGPVRSPGVLVELVCKCF